MTVFIKHKILSNRTILNTHTLVCIGTRLPHPHMHFYKQVPAHMHKYTLVPPLHTQVHTGACTQVHTAAYTQVHTSACTQAQVHTGGHTHAQVHTSACRQAQVCTGACAHRYTIHSLQTSQGTTITLGQVNQFSTCPSGKTSCPYQSLKINQFHQNVQYVCQMGFKG